MRKTILSCLPLIPMVMHWILPAGIENRLYVNIAGEIPFFIFNICYFIYIFKYKKLVSAQSNELPHVIRYSTIIFSVCYLSYSLVHGFLSGVSGLLVQMTNNQALVFALLLFLLYPMSQDMIERTKYIIIPTAVVLSLEVLLYSLGILEYSLELGTNESAGILRISTTVGAATGTAVVLVMLGVVLLYYESLKKMVQFGLVILVTIAIFLLQSRGSIAVWGVFLSYYLYRRFLVNSSVKVKLRIALLCVISVILLQRMGVFNPIIERQRTLVEYGNVDTGRTDLKEKAIGVFRESSGFGVGLGQTNYDKSLYLVKVKRSFPIGVHNHYLCVLAELGVCGLIILLLYLSNLLRFLDYKRPISIYILLLLFLIFSTEPIFSYSEFSFPASFLLMLSLNQKRSLTKKT